MIRPDKYVTSCCPTCHREGWTRRIQRTLYTTEERMALGWGEKFYSDKEKELIESAPVNAEICQAGFGGTIYEAVKEGKEIATAMQRPVCFCFNEHLVVVYRDSDVDDVVRKWWKAAYNETPEETYARR